MAQLTGLFLIHKSSPSDCVAAVPAWLNSLRSSNAVNLGEESIAESFAKQAGINTNDIVIG